MELTGETKPEEVSIRELGITTRSINILKNNGIETLKDLIDADQDTIERIGIVSTKYRRALFNRIAEMGYKTNWEL